MRERIWTFRRAYNRLSLEFERIPAANSVHALRESARRPLQFIGSPRNWDERTVQWLKEPEATYHNITPHTVDDDITQFLSLPRARIHARIRARARPRMHPVSSVYS